MTDLKRVDPIRCRVISYRWPAGSGSRRRRWVHCATSDWRVRHQAFAAKRTGGDGGDDGFCTSILSA